MTEQAREIQGIHGMEPNDRTVVTTSFSVGFPTRKDDGVVDVVRIEEHTENLGTHGISWFHVYGPGNRLLAKLNGTAVAEVHYR